MSSTNSTTNYELSQFLGSDKPAWLADYNSDMNKIDAQMKLNADAASTADGKGDTNAAAIGTLGNLTTDAKTNLVAAINEVDGHADTAQGTATNAATTANAAKTEADALVESFNLSATAYTYTDAVQTSGASAVPAAGEYWLAKNTAGTLCKLYGSLNISETASSGSCTIRLVEDSGLRPTAEFQVRGCGDAYDTGEYMSYPRGLTYTFKTTGEIDVTFNKSANKYTTLRMYACLIFVKNFGDTPE